MYEPGMSNAQGSSSQWPTSVAGWFGGVTSTIGSWPSGTTSTSFGTCSSTKSVVVMITSTSPASSAGMLACGSSSTSSTSRWGWFSVWIAGTARVWIELWNPPSRTRPDGSSLRPRSSASTASMWSRIERALLARISPAEVSRTRRPVRSSSCVRVSFSSTASCWDTLEALRFATCATARTVPSASSWLSSRRRHGFRVTLCSITEQRARDCEMDLMLAGS